MAIEYAIEADAGRCTASFPIFTSREEADAQRTMPALFWEDRDTSDGYPRLLVRMDGGPWEAVEAALRPEEHPGRTI